MRLLVLQPQQLQRDVLGALVVAMHFEPIRLGPTRPIVISVALEQPRLERKRWSALTELEREYRLLTPLINDTAIVAVEREKLSAGPVVLGVRG